MAELHEVAARCLAHPAPVLLLDTCALLDLIRIAGRVTPSDPTPPPAIAEAARRLLALAQLPAPQLYLICHELVPQEWAANEAEASKGPRAGLRRVRELLERFNEAAAALAIPEQVYRPGHLAERDGELVITRLTELSQRVLAASLLLDRFASCEQRAVQRSINNVPPASKGKPELKDCLIIEHYLELCRQLPADIPRVFVSSNVNDYGKNFNLFPPLAEEFAAVGLVWAKDFAHAQSLLGDE